jgi:hypothetical protein
MNSIMLSFSPEVNAAIIACVGSFIAAFISIYQTFISRRDNKKNITRIDLIQSKQISETKLDEFYIPLRHHLENSKTLFKILKKGKPASFRTLTHLLNKKQIYPDTNQKLKLSKNDISLIEAIIKIGKKIEKLIHDKSYLIGDDVEFVKEYIPRQEYQHLPYEQDMTLLSLLASHLVTIRMAFNDDLSGQKNNFEGFVFPNEINVRVNEKITELENEIINYDSQILKLNV